MSKTPKYPGIRVGANGNQLVAYMTEARLADAGIFYPITPSTEMGELFQLSYAEGKLNVFGRSKIALETEGEHAAQGGAIACSLTGRRVVNFTSGQGIAYGMEQYYHAPGKGSTMVVQIAARALTKHALNVHCGHDDFYGALDTGWIMLMAKDAQQAADQTLIIRKVTELSLTPGMNIQDGFLTSHLERTFYKLESGLIRDYLGDITDEIESPTAAQRELFGPTRPRVPTMVDLKNPTLVGPVQNQEHYMNGVVARRNNFCEPILGFLEAAYEEFAELTGRRYGLLTEYNCEGADTVFVSLGSAAENIDAVVDHLKETRGVTVGSIHVNVIRPFPAEAIVKALRGRKNVIILERTDEPMATDNPLARDIRVALSQAVEHHQLGTKGDVASLSPEEMPHLFRGIYGLGSRDFRPEAIIGAYEYSQGECARKDGRSAADSESFFVLGIDHPYEVVANETPSLLPAGAIAVRLHSIGGWGMITTGKNLGAIIGEFGDTLMKRAGEVDEFGRPKEVIHVSANPKYGSEKKGAPTAYFMTVAPKRIRVNCDLQHVNVVLCCDPKAFTHMNPITGMAKGGAFVWESDETPEKAWTRIPQRLRKEIIDKEVKLFILPGFDIAKKATDRPDLQLRMQGNAFLGAFFGVSSFLTDNQITREHFEETVHAQYKKKFGRFGDAVVASNMTVMTEGFSRVKPVDYGAIEADDNSGMRGKTLLPMVKAEAASCGAPSGPSGGTSCGTAPSQPERINLFKTDYYDAEFRAGLGYCQPASPLAALGVISAATGATNSKYVARRETPVYIAENCTQCMACISACPDTALPNTAQDVSVVLSTSIENYVTNDGDRALLVAALPQLETDCRAAMNASVKEKTLRPFKEIVGEAVLKIEGVSEASRGELAGIIDIAPMAYSKTNALFKVKEKREPGEGGLFSIFVSDLCKGCGECVTECGDHEALVMKSDSEELNAEVRSTMNFLDLLPDTDQKYLGLYNKEDAHGSRTATLRNHLMVQSVYDALVSGDGACAGCGEKSVLRALATLTEAFMRPAFHAKAERLNVTAERLAQTGVSRLKALKARSAEEHALYRRAIAHCLMGLGGESDSDTELRLAEAKLDDEALVAAIVTVLRQDAFNHRELKAIDGRLGNGMSVMAMGAHTGCNTVYGSTSPNNPHPYPWMNSLFQDGATITWIFGESFIIDHARRSVVPERLADALLERESEVITEGEYFDLTHFTDNLMSDREIRELPKAWCIGGDGGMGDIGFQNVSKVVLQNRPNVLMLMLDTQVYSNTGGQNSDSSVMTGGFDMNQIGAATQGKLTERKSVAECFTSGHGSPFVAQVSMGDQPTFYRAILDALDYRGTAFFQCFTTCQPEHGVGDDMATVQAVRVRDSRGMCEFVFNPDLGETYAESMDIKGNPRKDRDWQVTRDRSKEIEEYYTVAHWAVTEARFRRHVKIIKEEATKDMIHLDDMLTLITQRDIVQRRFSDPKHRAFVPDWGVYINAEDAKGGKVRPRALSRQAVLFCVERRKAWRLLQSRVNQRNLDYEAQKVLLAKLEKGELSRDQLLADGRKLLEAEVTAIKG